ncbi:ATP-binding protein [Streptomyces sp. ISL-100]|uniref:ATP-binding protein n=1 Tax=Streptomyces sp. ISL-100 TaxID=2819173 RepID=UPI001BE6CE72|nr:ATP-binding protein [Streptomyces sp. ISL-100]MBT2394820.1 ATP-binding protein [Streptomyces sp. ISL-100]
MVTEGVHLNSGGPQERLLEFDFTREDVPRLRVLVDQYAAWAGLAEPRRGDFVLAADAVATNAVEHGGGGGRLLLHRSPGVLECTISDSGPGFAPSVIPDLAPGLGGSHCGRGLWITRLITDGLVITGGVSGVGGAGGGSVVAFTMGLPG